VVSELITIITISLVVVFDVLTTYSLLLKYPCSYELNLIVRYLCSFNVNYVLLYTPIEYVLLLTAYYLIKKLRNKLGVGKRVELVVPLTVLVLAMLNLIALLISK
jgi:hypothetical protein